MKKTVEVTVINEVNSADGTKEDVIMKGRLLGALSITEGTKVIQNNEVAKRMATAESVSLTDTLKALKTIREKEPHTDKNGRILVVVKAMKRESDTIMLDTKSRQLFMSAPIDLVTGERFLNGSVTQAEFACDDKSVVTITETEES